MISPKENELMVTLFHRSLGMTEQSLSSTCLTLSFQRLIPNRLDTRSTWVSTASEGSLNATLMTTFAVLRPTPAKLSNS